MKAAPAGIQAIYTFIDDVRNTNWRERIPAILLIIYFSGLIYLLAFIIGSLVMKVL